LVLKPSHFEDETDIEKLTWYNAPGNGQILAELIQAGGDVLLYREIYKLVNSVWNKEELPQQWKECIFVLIYKNGDKTKNSDFRGISLLPTTYKILFSLNSGPRISSL
jgi:hypothetical protein